MLHLVVVGDRDPVVFALDLAPVQLVGKGGDVSFWSVAPGREEIVLDGHLLLGDNYIPRADLVDHCFYCLVFTPYVVFLEFLDVLHIDGHDDGLDRH